MRHDIIEQEVDDAMMMMGEAERRELEKDMSDSVNNLYGEPTIYERGEDGG